MATIRQYELKNGAKRWEFQVYLGRDAGTGKQINKHQQGFKTEEDAKLAAKQMELQALKNEYDYHDTKKYTVGEYLDFWINDLKQDVKEGTLIVHRYNIKRYIKPYIGKYSLTKYDLKAHQQFINKLFTAKGLGRSKQGLSWGTVKLVNATLGTALKKAVKLGYIDKNPTVGVEFPRKYQPTLKDKKLHYWSAEQVDKFLETAEHDGGDPMWYLFFLIIFDAGLRVGEVMALKWSDLDFKTGSLNVERERLYRAEKPGKIVIDTTKTMAGTRQVPMTERLQEAAIDYKNNRISRRYHDDVIDLEEREAFNRDFVFRYVRGSGKDHVVRSRATTTAFNRIIKKAGLPHIRIHDGRHTNAVRLRQSGVSLDDIGDLLGHKDPSTTKIYAEVTPLVKEKAIQKLDDFLNSN